jgi:ABC-type transport system substrate-binding protein
MTMNRKRATQSRASAIDAAGWTCLTRWQRGSAHARHSLAPTWFDPAEHPGTITPYMMLYALRDGMVRPMPGNAATRLEAFVVDGGTYVYGSYPYIDGLFKEQVNELDRKKREAILHRMQQLVHDKAMFIPIAETTFLTGHGPRIEESAVGLIAGQTYSAPYEDVKLKPSPR